MKPIKLANKRERWGLTGWGWLVVLILLTVWIWLTARNIVPFLSKEETIAARVMVLEGYVPDYTYDEIMRIFNEEHYELLIATGTSYDQGFYISGISSAAELIGKVNGGESGVERRRIRRPTRAGKSIQSGLSAAIDGE